MEKLNAKYKDLNRVHITFNKAIQRYHEAQKNHTTEL